MIIEEELTKDERYIQYEVLVPQCKKVCNSREVDYKYFETVYQVCNIFALTPKICEKYSVREAVNIIRSLKEKGFVFEFEKEGCDTPSFIPLGWHQIREVEISYTNPPANYQKT